MGVVCVRVCVRARACVGVQSLLLPAQTPAQGWQLVGVLLAIACFIAMGDHTFQARPATQQGLSMATMSAIKVWGRDMDRGGKWGLYGLPSRNPCSFEGGVH